ncbi:MAG TPA: DUF4382 domain-containing protein [Puia sp.]|nr:DUF4382 domain-containing protein [Puia sp.]
MKTVTKWLTTPTRVVGTLAGLAAVLIFFACNKSSSSNSNPNIPKGQSQVSMYMMDGPGDFFKVLIDIRQISIEVDTAMKQNDQDNDDQWDDDYDGEHRDAGNKSVIWDTLNITPGVYDMLSLRNGVDTLIGSGIFKTGKIVKIKVTIGSDNTVYIDSTTHFTLNFPGTDTTHTFTVNVHREDVDDISSNDFKMWIDFNIARSIFSEDGQFFLQPFLEIFNDQTSAKVYGQVLPDGAGALVTGYMGTDTIYAVPNEDGRFEFRNVSVGTWSFNFKGSNGYQDTTISSIAVDSTKTVTLPTITLHK